LVEVFEEAEEEDSDSKSEEKKDYDDDGSRSRDADTQTPDSLIRKESLVNVRDSKTPQISEVYTRSLWSTAQGVTMYES
jgi:hypothetical protein